MKNIWKNNSWFSIVMAMGLTIFIWLTALYLLEYIIPFGRNVKWVENASKAYYQANSGVEQSLWLISQNDLGYQNAESIGWDAIDYWYQITANGSQIPLLWKGNSEFDQGFNIFSRSRPIQLEVWNNRILNWNDINFIIRVPNTTITNSAYTLAGWSNPIVNWQLSSTVTTLNSDDSLITSNDINSTTNINLGTRYGQDLDENTPQRLRDFYTDNCGSGSGCVLKLSVIWPLKATASARWSLIPYLEYQINFWSASVPLRFAQIESTGKSFGFRKDIQVAIPQLTVDEAFDFTVLQ